jgi:tetratricopeptide (TPR) repeat protein
MTFLPRRGIVNSRAKIISAFVLCAILLASRARAQDAASLLLAGDELFKKRAAGVESLQLAVERWEKAGKLEMKKAEPLYKIAMAHHYLAFFSGAKDPSLHLKKAMDAATAALAREPKSAGANYWYCVLKIEVFEGKSPTEYLAQLEGLRKRLQIALDADKTFEEGGPDRTLGRMLFRSKLVFPEEAEKHARSAVEIGPNSAANLVLLGEILARKKSMDECREVLKKVDSLTPSCGNEKELAAEKEKARSILAGLPQ